MTDQDINLDSAKIEEWMEDNKKIRMFKYLATSGFVNCGI